MLGRNDVTVIPHIVCDQHYLLVQVRYLVTERSGTSILAAKFKDR